MQSDLENHKRLTWCVLAVLSLLVAGCVKPGVETPNGGTTQIGSVPTIPGAVQVQPGTTPSPQPPADNNTARIQQYFQQNLGFTLNNVQVIGRLNLPSGLDVLENFIYQNELGQTCVGIVQATAQAILVGDSRCMTTPPTVAGALLFQPLNNPNFYVAIYGYVDPVAEPTANAVAVQFPSGLISQQVLTNYGFIIPQEGLEFPGQVVFIREDGNTINFVPIQ